MAHETLVGSQTTTEVSIEYFNQAEVDEWNECDGRAYDKHTPGYYWAYCQVGCLPDSNWRGPYDTYAEAYAEVCAEHDEVNAQ